MSSGSRGLLLGDTRAEDSLESGAATRGAPKPVASLSSAEPVLSSDAMRDSLLRGASRASPTPIAPSSIQTQELARALADKARLMLAQSASSEMSTRAFTQHLDEIVLLIKNRECAIGELDIEFERIHGRSLRRVLSDISKNNSTAGWSTRHASTFRLSVEVEGMFARDLKSPQQGMRHDVAGVLARNYVRPLLEAASPDERRERLRMLEEAFLEMRRQRIVGEGAPAIIDTLVLLQESHGIDLFVELSKHLSPTDLGLTHALALELDERVDAIQFLARLDKAESIAEMVSYFPAVEKFDAFEREVVALAARDPATLLMERSLTLHDRTDRVIDETLHRAELSIVQALFSRDERDRLYGEGIVASVGAAARSHREQVLAGKDAEVISETRLRAREAAIREGALHAARLSLEALPEETESADIRRRELLPALQAAELSSKIERLKASQGLNAPREVAFRRLAEFGTLVRECEALVEQTSDDVRARVAEVPEGFLREHYLKILSEELGADGESASEGLKRADLRLQEMITQLGNEVILTATRGFLADVESLRGQPRLHQYATISRLFSEVPSDLIDQIALCADAEGETLESRIQALGGASLLEFSRAVQEENSALCAALTIEQLLVERQSGAVLAQLIDLPLSDRSEVLSLLERGGREALLSKLGRLGLSDQETVQLEQILQADPEQLLRLQVQLAAGLLHAPIDLRRLNELLQSASPEQRLAIGADLAKEERESLLLRMTHVSGGDRAMAEIAYELLRTGPQPTKQIEQALQFLVDRAERDALRAEANALTEKRLEQNAALQAGAFANVRELDRTMNEQGGLVSLWSWTTGVTAATSREKENLRTLAREYQDQRKILLELRDEVQKASRESRAEEDRVLNALIFGRQQEALAAKERAQQSLQQVADALTSPRASALPDFSRHQRESLAFTADLDSSIRALNNWETGLKVTRTGVIIVGGVVVVCATGGAAAAAIPAWKAGLLVTAFATPGTVLQGSLDVHYGNKSVGEATKDSAIQVGTDFLSAWGGATIGRAFNPRFVVTGGGEAVGADGLKRGVPYTLRQIAEKVGLRAGPTLTRDPTTGGKVGALLTEKGLVNVQRVGSFWGDISRGFSHIVGSEVAKFHLSRLTQPLQPVTEERLREEPTSSASLRPRDPDNLLISAEELEKNRRARLARVELPGAESSVVTPPENSTSTPSDHPAMYGLDASPTSDAPPPGASDGASFQVDTPGDPPKPGDAPSEQGGGVDKQAAFDLFAGLRRLFGIRQAENSVPLVIAPVAAAPEQVDMSSANGTDRKNTAEDPLGGRSPILGPSPVLQPTMNSYTAAIQNAQRTSPVLTLTQPGRDMSVDDAQKETLRRQVAVERRERELERIRFLERQSVLAIEQATHLANLNRRWMEELQAMAQQRLAEAVRASAIVQKRAQASGEQNQMSLALADGKAEEHSRSLEQQTAQVLPMATGLSQVHMREDAQRGLAAETRRGQPETLSTTTERIGLPPDGVTRSIEHAGSHRMTEQRHRRRELEAPSTLTVARVSNPSKEERLTASAKAHTEVQRIVGAGVPSNLTERLLSISKHSEQIVASSIIGSFNRVLAEAHASLPSNLQGQALDALHVQTANSIYSLPLSARLAFEALHTLHRDAERVPRRPGEGSLAVQPSVSETSSVSPRHFSAAQGVEVGVSVHQGTVATSGSGPLISPTETPARRERTGYRTGFKDSLGSDAQELAIPLSSLWIDPHHLDHYRRQCEMSHERFEDRIRIEEEQLERERHHAMRALRAKRLRRKRIAQHRAKLAARRILEELAAAAEHVDDDTSLDASVKRLLVPRARVRRKASKVLIAPLARGDANRADRVPVAVQPRRRPSRATGIDTPSTSKVGPVRTTRADLYRKKKRA